jgi:GNAT superfamily N-acetyltransferase
MRPGKQDRDDGSAAEALVLRRATLADVPLLEALIAGSARALGLGHYPVAAIEAAVRHIYGVDRALIADGTYFVATLGGDIVGCGGWSGRRTLFGGDRWSARDDTRLDPASEAARIRAFFVAPGTPRRGVGSALLAAAEADAIRAGFRSAELMATLPGLPFYAARGYAAGQPVTLDAGGIGVEFVPMRKDLLLNGNMQTSSEDLIAAPVASTRLAINLSDID